MPNTLTLLPVPRTIKMRDDAYTLKPNKRIALLGIPAQSLLPAGQRLRSALAKHNWTLTATTTGSREDIGAILRLDIARFKNDQAYELDITPQGIEIVGASPRAVFYGVCTLGQILQQPNYSTNKLACLHISDSPDYPNRGVMLDISRDKVPTMQTLLELIDMLASWKINHVQLYTEHTFAYRNHRDVWQNASPMTEQDILDLDSFCRARYIELVPNQNSFGHMHRWLTLKRYNDLADCPDGVDMPWRHLEPFTLNPLDPRNLDLVRELYDELLPNFTSHQFNIGCDETFDLGRGKSKDECDKRGTERVYLDFLLKIQHEVKQRGYRMLFWGDIIIQHPELISELPRDVVALEWGYEAEHPFDEDGAAFAKSNIPFYVCPGTSSWNTIAGRTDNMLNNISNAAENGLKHGAIGLLNTDWGDNGHWQYLPMSYLGFAYGAATSWSLDANRNIDLARATSLFAFDDTTGALGKLAYDLGNTYLQPGIEIHNSSVLFRILQMPLEKIRKDLNGLTPQVLAQTEQYIDNTMRHLSKVKSQRVDAQLIAEEFESAAEILHHACQRGLLALETDVRQQKKLKRELAKDLQRIIAKYDHLWHARNRHGGFKESVARWKKLGKDYK